MIVKSGLEKIVLKLIHAPKLFSLLHKIAQNYKFSNKNVNSLYKAVSY